MPELHILHFIALCVALVAGAAALIIHDVRHVTKRHNTHKDI
jgi:hypothetical protein